ncbi:hypothetical protein HDU81_008172, partial [Chytriomyces hyalinus]
MSSLAFNSSNTVYSAATPANLPVKWMAAAMDMERRSFRELLEEKDDLLEKLYAQLKQKDDRLAQYATQVRGLQLDILELSRDGYSWEHRCRKLEDEQIFAHLDHHAERTSLNHTLKQADSAQRELRKMHLTHRIQSARQESVLRMELECTRSRMSRLQQDLDARDRTLVAERGMAPGTALQTFRKCKSGAVGITKSLTDLNAFADCIESPQRFAAEHTVGRYISKGTDGEVWEASRCCNGVRRARAVKAVKVAQMGLARIMGEIQIGLLVNSPHVVPVYEVFREDGGASPEVLITMELMR